MDWRQVVAGNLRRIRRERGFSQEDLATDADVNRTYISKLEKGSTWVGLEVLVKISKVLQVEPADFLQRPARKPAKKA
ncbi:helix-turn-helix domain-containing protein [Bradyrhizobium sp. CCBAU 25338]|uniref:helix-turn-helix domain-containing protein n=1 Tax=Bradyrhizobium sp. CCBAU 25338 TaxID=1641877 RepID=UPI0023047085|nr:helix-turn-helix transcriptional regulator [Bradyrhizobium sp. CCBAU 25338]MDA9529794.1 XRE family transcriptional regulator [Bradyrhizobium sp. CCBAU 25338]